MWREAPWPLIITNILFTTTADWVRFILKPGQLLSLPFDQHLNFTRFGAILLDSIWFTRNQLLHKGGGLNIIDLLFSIRSRYVELVAAWEDKPPTPILRC